jgi:hypothetical protein
MFSLIAVSSATSGFKLAVCGSVGEDQLPEIIRYLDAGRRISRAVTLDLSEVTLIDRTAARFFAEQIQRGAKLLDCPSYLEQWILREVKDERAHQNQHRFEQSR